MSCYIRIIELSWTVLDDTLAEKAGFEPAVRCRTHAFQACALNHSAISPLKIKLITCDKAAQDKLE